MAWRATAPERLARATGAGNNRGSIGDHRLQRRRQHVRHRRQGRCATRSSRLGAAAVPPHGPAVDRRTARRVRRSRCRGLLRCRRWSTPIAGAVLVSSVCADAGDALARSHTATANRPRRRKPPITATFVVMIGIERCIAPRSTGHWLHPATYPPSRADKQDQSPKRTNAALFARCSPIEREVRAFVTAGIPRPECPVCPADEGVAKLEGVRQSDCVEQLRPIPPRCAASTTERRVTGPKNPDNSI